MRSCPQRLVQIRPFSQIEAEALLTLTPPTEYLYPSWSQAASEWPADSHQDGTGLRLAPDPIDQTVFTTWVRRLRQHADHSLPVPAGEVHTTFLWIMTSDTYAGAIDTSATTSTISWQKPADTSATASGPPSEAWGQRPGHFGRHYQSRETWV